MSVRKFCWSWVTGRYAERLVAELQPDIGVRLAAHVCVFEDFCVDHVDAHDYFFLVRRGYLDEHFGVSGVHFPVGDAGRQLQAPQLFLHVEVHQVDDAGLLDEPHLAFERPDLSVGLFFEEQRGEPRLVRRDLPASEDWLGAEQEAAHEGRLFQRPVYHQAVVARRGVGVVRLVAQAQEGAVRGALLFEFVGLASEVRLVLWVHHHFVPQKSLRRRILFGQERLLDEIDLLALFSQDLLVCLVCMLA